jgi:protein-disulfide isomerase
MAKKITIIFLVVMGLGLFGYLLANTSNGSDPIREEKKDYLSLIDLEDSPALGEEDAPVIMVNYSSYYCPFCSRFKLHIFPEIKEKYIDTGKVRYFYKDAGNPEDNVFLSAHCAGFENRFWDYQSLLIERGIQQEEDLYSYARELGLDVEKFTECLEEGCCSHIIEQTQREMIDLNIQNIPYFIINETAVSGLESVEGFFEIIDKELAKKGEN